jgi:hypothetical protein
MTETNVPTGTSSDNQHLDISAHTDQHIAWWAELKRLEPEAAEGSDPAQVSRFCDLESLIVETAPATPEGAAIVASELLRFQEDAPGLDIDQEAGRTLAQWFLASLSPDARRRAGLE